ncbi:UBX domain protein [Aspergillus terreus]|uniref:UBX domain-containing protein 2 n=1 Tax=Aspergillus terreus TaxID=33178 RepID=A0A5M3ZD73_ASPTE|nr:hypothetical protein ATETN484_0012030900 [Aspergillus terreus]GFF19557.1 UBX domain protein [Aspergillus terreus]
MFFSGTLQEGIALAVSQAKAVICFVRDDGETSSRWEEEYFSDEEFAQLLATKSVLLRLPKDSQEAGFLTSFCPITKFPTVVVIKNGMLRDYIVPEISKDHFHARLRGLLDGGDASGQLATSAQNSATDPSATSTPAPAPVPEPQPASTPVEPRPEPRPSQTQTQNVHARDAARTTQRAQPSSQSTPASQSSVSRPQPPKSKHGSVPKSRQPKQESKPKEEQKPKISITKRQPTVEAIDETTEERKPSTSLPPTQYRLQVRLFDGSSIRSSFAPSQTIRRDVRPWIDSQITEGKRPYNLKHILTPQPNHTLTIAEEEQKLEELGWGSSANLVMVPISSYTEAYSSPSSSLPVRAVSSVYGLVSSAVGLATGLVGSFLPFGSGQTTPSEASPAANTPSSGNSTPRPRAPASRGPNIRTLRDQAGEQDDRQFYNGNQLNFEPRRDSDTR